MVEFIRKRWEIRVSCKSIKITYQDSVIGSKIFKGSYVFYLNSKWCRKLTQLSEIAKTQPQDGYGAFTSVYRHVFPFLVRTIKNISNFMSPVEKIVREKLIPALFDGFQISDELRKFLARPFKLGQMVIIDPTENC